MKHHILDIIYLSFHYSVEGAITIIDIFSFFFLAVETEV